MSSMRDLHIESTGLTHEWLDLIGDSVASRPKSARHLWCSWKWTGPAQLIKVQAPDATRWFD